MASMHHPDPDDAGDLVDIGSHRPRAVSHGLDLVRPRVRPRCLAAYRRSHGQGARARDVVGRRAAPRGRGQPAADRRRRQGRRGCADDVYAVRLPALRDGGGAGNLPAPRDQVLRDSCAQGVKKAMQFKKSKFF